MKLFNKIHFVFLAFLALASQSCQIGNDDKEVVIQVQDEFEIEIIEALGVERQLRFNLSSIEMEPCLNNTIDRTVFVNNDAITLLINGINQATDCNPGVAPALATGNAGVLQNGIYDFNVTIRNTIENQGKMVVSDDMYEINLLNNDGIVIDETVLRRIPPNTIWGYAAFDDSNIVGNTPDAFISDVKTISQPLNLNAGYYGIFDITADNDIHLKELSDHTYHSTFLLKYNGELDELRGILENHRSSFEEENLSLVIYTATGQIL